MDPSIVNDKNETTRFVGDGQCFKAKLIGILEVSEARGDRMCQEALSDLKMAIRAAGEHKQRITVNIALDGLRLRDEKTGDSLYHHPVHKISFIAQDMTDSRAFGYIFGSPDTGHRFFGIKTDKAASQVVIAMRDLFQVVFALKKKEIELAKQHLEKNSLFNSPLFSDSSSNKSVTPELPLKNDTSKTENKASASNNDNKSSGTAVADLVDLELELNSLQQGLNQMERITPSDPFGSKGDPFGDSFTSFPKPILPPPPSGRDRTSRTSESSSLFSPRTPQTTTSIDSSNTDMSHFRPTAKRDFKFSRDFSSSHEDHSSGDWFTPCNSIFEESSTIPEPTKDEKHEMTKQEILSQFDVFTELDPLGTGRSKPYIDKKHFFQELKNPPKKVLNDLVLQNQPQQEPNTIMKTAIIKTTNGSATSAGFTSDPFGEDPFVSLDPFAETDFKQDPFETDFNDYNNKNNLKKVDYPKTDVSQNVFQSNISKSPNSSLLENSIQICGTSPRNVQFNNSYSNQYNKFKDTGNKFSQLHENPSLDISSESECAPEPPPRPAATLLQIKPPPLPPKKPLNDLMVKPPPRPPHLDDSHYDYMDNYETAPSSLEFIRNIEKAPALPIPIRKSKFDNDFTSAPERPTKQFVSQSYEDEYLTPISFPEQNDFKSSSGAILLPPPQKHSKKSPQYVPVTSQLNTQTKLTKTPADNANNSLDGLDITLSQLTLSGLNELAHKLNIPTSQLSNMTLVQLTNYLSSVIKSKTDTPSNVMNKEVTNDAPSDFPAFKADFDANFGGTSSSNDTYDRYAVFRELMKEEIKQTKIDTEPEEFRDERETVATTVSLDNSISALGERNVTEDRYAALREIVEGELKRNEESTNNATEDNNKNETDEIENRNEENVELDKNENQGETDIINIENKINTLEKLTNDDKDTLIDYNSIIENKTIDSSPKSPLKSNVVRSPVPVAITEIMQNNTRLNSGSLSDVVSGSSPEVDNTASNSEVGKKMADAAGETWAIFDQANLVQEFTKEKQATQSEDAVSPWSSDSKEYGNGSPSDWKRRDSDQWSRRSGRRDQEGWWDTSAEPEAPYCSSNRRSTDSYDDEYHECYDRPRRRRQGNWSGRGSNVPGGHSSSSRDVSPWEEEPRRRDTRSGGRDGRPGWSSHARQLSFERHRERRPTDSWDEEDDYEYEDECRGRFHWKERLSSRESDRHGIVSRDHEGGDPRVDRWSEEWSDAHRQWRRRGEVDRDRWCCPDWEETEHEKPARYPSVRYPTGGDVPMGKRRERKHENRCYSRDSQESLDEYSVEQNESHSAHYLTAKRNWKRPSSASEMDRKTGEIKSRHYLGSGGSDGERDRRYKSNRRSRSRDSQYSEPSHRHKVETGMIPRANHRLKGHQMTKPQFENDFSDAALKKQTENSKLDLSNKKASTLANRKKKESPKIEEKVINTFPRKSASRNESLFENDFQPDVGRNVKCSFENDFETLDEKPPIANKNVKLRPSSQLTSGIQITREYKETKLSPRYLNKAKSLFEDDFSPCEKIEQCSEDNGISIIKEEVDVSEEHDSFGTVNFEQTTNSRRTILIKNRFTGGLRSELKKSESVNIFRRENDPFDDDFFCENTGDVQLFDSDKEKTSRISDLKWTDEYEKERD